MLTRMANSVSPSTLLILAAVVLVALASSSTQKHRGLCLLAQAVVMNAAMCSGDKPVISIVSIALSIEGYDRRCDRTLSLSDDRLSSVARDGLRGGRCESRGSLTVNPAHLPIACAHSVWAASWPRVLGSPSHLSARQRPSTVPDRLMGFWSDTRSPCGVRSGD